MPTVTRKGKGKKTAAKATTAKPKEAAAKSNRRTAEDVDALVPEFLAAIKKGATLRQLKQDFGFSDDGPIRAALYRAGFDRKGEEHGEDADSIDASKAAGKKQLVALRQDEGAAWYRLAFLAGITEAEAKAIVKDAGGPTGRVYIKTEKPAKAEKSGGKKSTAKKAKAKAKAAKSDPSDQD